MNVALFTVCMMVLWMEGRAFHYGVRNDAVLDLQRCHHLCRNGRAKICPRVQPENATCDDANRADDKCITAADCEKGLSCCHNGCNKACVQPEAVKTKRQKARCLNKCIGGRYKERLSVGKCPAVRTSSNENSTCDDDCSGDDECLGRLKCCSTGCGKQCVIPVGTDCVSSRKIYKNGQSIPSTRDTLCVCDAGTIACSRAPVKQRTNRRE